MVVSYSPKRAKKDEADRERLIEKAKLLLNNPEKIKASNKRGGKKYIDQVGPDKDKAKFLTMIFLSLNSERSRLTVRTQ